MWIYTVTSQDVLQELVYRDGTPMKEALHKYNPLYKSSQPLAHLLVGHLVLCKVNWYRAVFQRKKFFRISDTIWPAWSTGIGLVYFWNSSWYFRSKYIYIIIYIPSGILGIFQLVYSNWYNYSSWYSSNIYIIYWSCENPVGSSWSDFQMIWNFLADWSGIHQLGIRWYGSHVPPWSLTASLPLKSYRDPIGKSSSNHHFSGASW